MVFLTFAAFLCLPLLRALQPRNARCRRGPGYRLTLRPRFASRSEPLAIPGRRRSRYKRYRPARAIRRSPHRARGRRKAHRPAIEGQPRVECRALPAAIARSRHRDIRRVGQDYIAGPPIRVSQPPTRKLARPARPSASALPRAMATAPGEISMPMPVAWAVPRAAPAASTPFPYRNRPPATGVSVSNIGQRRHDQRLAIRPRIQGVRTTARNRGSRIRVSHEGATPARRHARRAISASARRSHAGFEPRARVSRAPLPADAERQRQDEPRL